MTISALAPATPPPAATPSTEDHPSLSAESLDLRYDRDLVVQALSVAIPVGRITTIVGPNACGKSTLLRALARLLAPAGGRVLLGDQDLARQRTRDVARRLTLLPQSPIAPDGITVSELVARGRYPYQSLFKPWSSEDSLAVAAAMEATGVTEVTERPVNHLSGGQRQRVWVAMALAQDTPLLLLDEPTTYLDLAHQIEVLDLLKELNDNTGRTVVLVLHDLNLASRYSDHLIAMAAGRIEAEGAPHEVITEDVVRRVFGLETRIVPDPVSDTPLVIPIGRAVGASEESRAVGASEETRAHGVAANTAPTGAGEGIDQATS
jgi:iron complex transport system ATP-binding protein